MFDRFTDNARRVINTAIAESHRRHQRLVGTEHVLFGILQVTPSTAHEILLTCGAIIDFLCDAVDKAMPVPSVHTQPYAPTHFSEQARAFLEASVRSTSTTNGELVGTEHLLLELLKSKSPDHARQLLVDVGIALQAVEKEVAARVRPKKTRIDSVVTRDLKARLRHELGLAREESLGENS